MTPFNQGTIIYLPILKIKNIYKTVKKKENSGLYIY